MVDSEVSADGGDPAEVKRVTIGFNAISALAAGKVDAATGFWNAEGVALRQQGVPIRIFKVNRYGAPPYPELVLVASRQTIEQDPSWSNGARGDDAGLRVHIDHPSEALDDLLAEVPEPRPGRTAGPARALLPDLDPAPFDPAVLSLGRLGLEARAARTACWTWAQRFR